MPRAPASKSRSRCRRSTPGKIDFTLSKKLIGSDDVIRRLQAAEDPRLIQNSFADAVESFAARREPYLLYR